MFRSVAAVCAVVTLLLSSAIVSGVPAPAGAAPVVRGAPLSTYFVPAASRGSSGALFIGQGRGFLVRVRSTGLTLESGSSRHPAVAQIAFPHGGHPTVLAQQRLAFTSTYLLGMNARSWRRDVPAFGQILIRNVGPGIGLRFSGTPTGLRYDWVSSRKPAAFPRLSIHLSQPSRSGAIQTAPRSDEHAAAAGRFSLRGHAIRFSSAPSRVAALRGRLLTDPSVSYATVLPPALDDPVKVAVTAKGEILAAGPATPAVAPLPISPTDVGSPCPQGSDALACSTVYVARLTAAGVLESVTYVGGTGLDSADDLTLDASGNVYVVGRTMSPDFPVLGGLPAASAAVDNQQGFVLALNPAADHLLFSSLIGGSDDDEVTAVAITPSGSIDIVGGTRSNDFPTRSAVQGSRSGGDCEHSAISTVGPITTTAPCQDIVVAQLAPMAAGLTFSTYLGGTQDDGATAVAIDGGGNIYLTGVANSTDFPLAHPIVSEMEGEQAGIVAKFSPTGSLVYSTYLQGFTNEVGNAIAVDASGAAYVAGATDADDFPVTSHALQTTAGGGLDGFVVKIAPDGASFVYSTYLGGSEDDSANGIALDGTGAAYVVGDTQSTDFPTVPDATSEDTRGSDGFVTRLSPDGSQATSSMYLGGSDDDGLNTVALGANGQLIVAGLTASSDFPGASVPAGSPDDDTPGYGVVAALSGLIPATPTPIVPTATSTPRPTAVPAKTKTPTKKVTCKKGYKKAHGKCVKKKKKH